MFIETNLLSRVVFFSFVDLTQKRTIQQCLAAIMQRNLLLCGYSRSERYRENIEIVGESW